MPHVRVTVARLSLLLAVTSIAQAQPVRRAPAPKVPVPRAASGAAAPGRIVSVDSATRAFVTLSWKGDDAAATKFVVERKVLGAAWPVATASVAATGPATLAAIAMVDAAKVTDSAIDPWTTYVYRVRGIGAANALSAPSTEVIVGPPPVGFSSVIASPKAMQEHDASQFGDQIRMAFDANGDPMLSWITFDLNLDGENPDSELSLITWSRTRYRWNPPVAIDTVGDVVRSGTRMPVSLTLDTVSGQVGVLYAVGDRDLRLATSDDGGRTWKKVIVEHAGAEEPGLSTPSLALVSGRAHVAYARGANTVVYRTGLVSAAPSTWPVKTAPKLPDTDEARAECVSLVLDAAAKPAVSYCLSAANYNTLIAMWRPESGAAVKVSDTNNKQNDDPGVAIAVRGSELALAFYGARDEQFFANHQIWFTHSRDGGATWSPMVAVADDGGNAMGAPVSTSVDRAGHFAIAAQMNGGNEGSVKCGLPKLMRSPTGTTWTTCAPDTRGLGGVSDVGNPMSPTAAFAGNDKLYYAMKLRSPAAGLLPGIALWRER